MFELDVIRLIKQQLRFMENMKYDNLIFCVQQLFTQNLILCSLNYFQK